MLDEASAVDMVDVHLLAAAVVPVHRLVVKRVCALGPRRARETGGLT
jgi:hypothetical protein